MRRPSGFSLIELIVVMVIAGILAAIAIPRFTDTESNASWYYEQVKAGVRYAQRQAVAQHRTIFVEVQAGQVALCYAPGCAGGAPLTQIVNGQAYLLLAPNGVALQLTDLIDVALVPQSISFNALGQPSREARLHVGAANITITAETGYVR